MYCSTTSPPAMLSNFKTRFHVHHSQPEQQPFLSLSESQADEDTSNTETVMTETVYVPGCTCPFCVTRSESEDVAEPASRTHACRSLPSFRSVMEVLYPPSYLGTPSPFPNPPSYSRNDSIPYPARERDTEVSPLISPAPTSQSHSPPHPLSQDPSLTGVPSHRNHLNRAPLVEPNPPCLYNDVPDEPLPAYMRFDQRRPRFPDATNILGPYPPMSVIRRSVR